MRVIGGTAKGHRLKSPVGIKIRPTADIVKEAFFDIIAFYIENAVFLDAFAGTGSIGIEALSRGAQIAYFVDNQRKCVELIKHNLSLIHMEDKAKVICADVIDSLRMFKQWEIRFDIIFIDPPYDKGYVKPSVHAFLEADILQKGGILAVQHSKYEGIETLGAVGEVYKQKRYGDTILSFVRRKNIENSGISRQF